MISFVRNAARGKIESIDPKLLAIAVEGLSNNAPRAFNIEIDPRKTQASFVPCLLTLGRDDLGINENKLLF